MGIVIHAFLETRHPRPLPTTTIPAARAIHLNILNQCRKPFVFAEDSIDPQYAALVNERVDAALSIFKQLPSCILAVLSYYNHVLTIYDQSPLDDHTREGVVCYWDNESGGICVTMITAEESNGQLDLAFIETAAFVHNTSHVINYLFLNAPFYDACRLNQSGTIHPVGTTALFHSIESFLSTYKEEFFLTSKIVRLDGTSVLPEFMCLPKNSGTQVEYQLALISAAAHLLAYRMDENAGCGSSDIVSIYETYFPHAWAKAQELLNPNQPALLPNAAFNIMVNDKPLDGPFYPPPAAHGSLPQFSPVDP